MYRAVMMPVVVLFACVLTLPTTAWAADTTEPFELGISDYEFYYSHAGRGPGDQTMEAVIGAGITPRFALSVAYDAEGFWSRWERAMGMSAFVALIEGQTAVDFLGHATVDGSSFGWGAGAEVSHDLTEFVPYARVGANMDGYSFAGMELLGGLKMALWDESLQCHLEVATELATGATPPLTVAVGPNWTLAPWVELIPHIQYTALPAASDSPWLFSIGTIVTAPLRSW